ncbi:MAG: DUF72 domain-containing protein [Syntrophobacterales bacterium]|nr:DUF72 domain-containing protein [Syntrophobacterales bacterium]
MTIKVGCCGFPVNRREYFRHLQLVEIQQTFYQPPRAETARRWRQEAPPEACFTLKAWQLITHEAKSPTYRRLTRPLSEAERRQAGAFRPTQVVREAWEVTREVAAALEARVVVFQCPASFTPTPEHREHLTAFFRGITRDDLLLAWEPRGAWPREEVERLCRELRLLPVVDPLATPSFPGPLAYFRLHGQGGYRYRYTDADLAQLARLVKERQEAYVLFNNLSMWEDAQRFARLLAGP